MAKKSEFATLAIFIKSKLFFKNIKDLSAYFQLLPIPTELSDFAFVTFWVSSQANVTPMKDQPVMRFVDVFIRNMTNKLLFYF